MRKATETPYNWTDFTIEAIYVCLWVYQTKLTVSHICFALVPDPILNIDNNNDQDILNPAVI